MSDVQVLPPHAPIPARVTALSSFMSRTPARIKARISPAVTRSQRQTMVSSSSRSNAPGNGSPTPGACTRTPAMRLA